MIRVGIAGIGFMGWIHWLAYRRIPGIEVVAFSSRDEAKRAGDWRSIKGNFGPPGEEVDVSQLTVHGSLEELYRDADVDLIDICLPPHAHTSACRDALAMGKHVFCEKPLALTAEDCTHLVEAADTAGKQLLVGHVLPFFPEFAEARRVVDSGRYGKLLGGFFKRTISDPKWLPDFYDPLRVGGPIIDLHVHDAHLIRLLFGMPESVDCVGRFRGEVVEYFQSAFRFADPQLVVGACGGVVRQQGRPFTHGFELHLEQATIQFEFAGFTDQGETMPLKVLDANGQVVRPDLGAGDPIDGFVGEIEEVVRALTSGQPSPLLSGELARDAMHLCQAQTESARRRGPYTIG